MKKIYIIFIALFFSLALVSASTYLDDCGFLDSQGEEYVLNGDIDSVGTCFAVIADDITLDCKGHTITYSNNFGGNGIIVQGSDRFFVKNCNIVQGSESSNSDAIILFNSESSFVVGNKIETIGPFSVGVWAERSSKNSVINNIISTRGFSSMGAAVYLSSDNNVFFSNDISTKEQIGIGLFGGILNNLIKNRLSNNDIDVYVRDGSLERYEFIDSSLVVEDPSYGILKYYDLINANGSDFSEQVSIWFNLVKIGNKDSGLDVPAGITIHHTDILNLDEKMPLRFNEPCPHGVCLEIFEDDSYEFNVTGFGDYSVGDITGRGDVNITTPRNDTNECVNNAGIVILPPGILVPVEDYELDFKILGSELSRGVSWNRHVTVQIKLGDEVFEPWGDYSTPVESNVNDGVFPKSFSSNGKKLAGTPISFSARSWHKRKFYNFGNRNEHWAIFNEVDTSRDALPVKILRNCDYLPNYRESKGQYNVAHFLEPYVEDGQIKIGDNQVIFLVELGEANFRSAAADWQDLVILATIKGEGELVESSLRNLPGITGFAVGNLTKNDVKGVLALVVLAVVLFSITLMRKRYG